MEDKPRLSEISKLVRMAKKHGERDKHVDALLAKYGYPGDELGNDFEEENEEEESMNL